MKKTEAIKAIDKAYYRLAGCCEHTHDWDRYVGIIEQEEKGHRRFCPNGLRCGLTKAQSIRLFAVKEVFDRFIPNESGKVFTPTAADFFRIRGSVFGACAIAESCKAEIEKEFTDREMVLWLQSIDYAELNKDPRMMEAA